MEKSVATLHRGTTCSAWNYYGERLAAGSVGGSLFILDSRNPSSYSFTCSSKFKAHEAGIVKVVWIPPEYGDAVTCISEDGTLSIWEELVEGTQPLQWKQCKSFKTSSKVLDVQFGVNQTSLKMASFKTEYFLAILLHASIIAHIVYFTFTIDIYRASFNFILRVAAYSDGCVKVFELLDPFELKNWQLQAEFQNVIDSVSTFRKASCLTACISWNPQRGEGQESSFILGFNSNTPQLNSPKFHRYGNLIQLIIDGCQSQSWLCLVTREIKCILLHGHQTLDSHMR